MRQPEAEQQPAVDSGIHRERLRGERDRVAGVGGDDRRAELDPGHLARPPTASTVSASNPALWGSQTDANPWSATARNRAVHLVEGCVLLRGEEHADLHARHATAGARPLLGRVKLARMSVDVTSHGAVRLVTINRPERANALDGATMGGIGTAFADAEADDSVQVVVLTGAGDRVFCAGMDLKAQGDERTPPAGSPGLEVLMNRCYPKPVIVAVNGAAMGGGFELVMASDLAVVADHVTFGVPEVKRGVVGAGCSTRTAMRVPPAIVFEMTLTGDPITAHRARELGLVNEVVPEDEVLDRAMALASTHRRERAHRAAHHEADRVGRIRQPQRRGVGGDPRQSRPGLREQRRARGRRRVRRTPHAELDREIEPLALRRDPSY